VILDNITTDRIYGIVYDHDETPVFGACITLYDAKEINILDHTTTGHQGEFSFPIVKEGEYTIKIEHYPACCMKGLIIVSKDVHVPVVVYLMYCPKC